MLNNFIKKLYHAQLFSSVFHTVVHELQTELKNCDTVLDLGCGPSSPLAYCPDIKYSVGVEPFEKYLRLSQKQKIHNRYLKAKIEDLHFPDKTFDAVMMVEVLEHLPKAEGRKIIAKMQKWAKKKVIITTPNGFISQKGLDGNVLQKHLSGWSDQEMQELGFQVRGLAGFKFLRQELPSDMIVDDITAAIKYKPRFFWFVVATLSQAFLFYYPKWAFELFNVKKII